MSVPTRDELRKQKVPIILYSLVSGKIVDALRVPGNAVDAQAEGRNNIAVKVHDWDPEDPYYIEDRYVDISRKRHPVRKKARSERDNMRMKDARKAARQDMQRLLNKITKLAIGEIPEPERLALSSKEEAAKRYLTGERIQEDIDMFQEEIDETGETMMQLVRAILRKAKKHKKVIGRISGTRRKVNTRLKEATTVNAVKNSLNPLVRLQERLQEIAEEED